jgi:hypothetical protein
LDPENSLHHEPFLICKECERLGQEYGELVPSHTCVEKRLLSPKLNHDHEQAAVFVIRMHDFASVRQEHQFEVHGNRTAGDKNCG